MKFKNLDKTGGYLKRGLFQLIIKRKCNKIIIEKRKILLDMERPLVISSVALSAIAVEIRFTNFYSRSFSLLIF